MRPVASDGGQLVAPKERDWMGFFSWLRGRDARIEGAPGTAHAAGVPKSRTRTAIVLSPRPVERQLLRPAVIAVANRKGGVGKTTTAVNMASCLAYMGHPTLLIDMDSQAHSTSGLGVERADVTGTALDVITGKRSVKDVTVDTTVGGLDLVPASVALSRVDIELVDHPERELQLSAALDPVRGDYDFVFIDTPPSLGLLTVNSLVAADDVLIPLQCEYFALEGVKDLVGIVKVVADNVNPDLKVEGILLTMYEPTPLSREIQNEVRFHFGDSVFRAVVPRDRRIAEAQSMGVPAIQYGMSSPGAQAYIKASRELSRRHADSE